ncbi:MAG: hypothetical protein Q9214_007400 [Letrouitia sp. 1 TL-2023]
MRHGKKLFEKIVWVFKNVLNKAVMWLFYNQDENPSTQQSKHAIMQSCLIRKERSFKAHSSAGNNTGPILRHHPTSVTCEPIMTQIPSSTMPVLRPASASAPRADFADWATETIEWHGLMTLKSPQTSLYHEIDPYLSRYSLPRNDAATAADIMIVQCENGLRHSSEPEKWFFIGAYAFQSSTLHGNDGYTVLGLPGRSLTEPEQRVIEGDAIEMNEHATVSLRDYVLWEFTNSST